MIDFIVDVEYKYVPSDAVDKGVRDTFAKAAPIIQKEAQDNHRYQSRTGNLRRSTVANATKNRIQAMIDEARAKYGKYVHRGHGSWGPDPFVADAIDNNLDKIEDILATSIDKQLDE